jgi:hypothetical protein
MTAAASSWRLALFASAAVGLVACGGGGSGASSSSGAPPPSGPNVVPLVVDAGPTANGSPVTAVVNQSYVTITICVPNSSNCQTIDHVWVDTGSTGLRVFSSSFTPSLPLALDPSGSGNAVANCAQFVGGYLWGSVRTADVKIGSEAASSVPIQVIGDTANGIPAPTSSPSTCVNSVDLNSVGALGGNGLLGIGLFRQDCGTGCAPGNAVPAHDPYYSCTTSGSCAQISYAVAQQLQNVVAMFPVDNTGVLIQLPSVPANGQTSASGSLVFGIGTRSNNMLGNAQVFLADPATGNFRTTTTYGDLSEPASYIDSGSNAFFFNDASLTACPGTPPSGFYCSPVTTRTATMLGYNSNTPSFNYGFTIIDFGTFNGNFNASSAIGGPSGTCDNVTTPCTFDWGLPFFYGRSVFFALEGQTLNGSPGPFFAASTP